MSVNKVHFKDFDSTKIIFGKIDEKTIDAGGVSVKYWEIPILYAYPNGKGPLYIQGPKETSRGPKSMSFIEKIKDELGNMVAKPGAKEKITHSVITKYDMTNPDHREFINYSRETPGTIHKICMSCAKFLLDHDNDIPVLKGCEDVKDMMQKLNRPVKWDIERGVLKEGENPGAIWKLFKYSKDSYTNETSFYLPIGEGQKVSWKMIENSKIEHTPLFRVNRITVAGSKFSVKMEMYSSVIKDILPLGGPNMQNDVIAEAAKDTEHVAKLLAIIEEQRAALESQNQTMSQITGANVPSIGNAMAGAGGPTVPMVIPGVETHTPPVQVATQPATVPVMPLEVAPPALVLPSTSGIATPEVPMTINSVLSTAPVIQLPVVPTGGQFVLPSLP